MLTASALGIAGGVAACAPASGSGAAPGTPLPLRTQTARASNGVSAFFTAGARTVTLTGPQRTFSEPGLDATFTTDQWVRFLPKPFKSTVDAAWLDRAAADTGDDLLAIAFQYVTGGPYLTRYGPELLTGGRDEGSDFNDYLGVPWVYGDGTLDKPELDQRGCLDCSGYVRMVVGYRMGLPLSLRSRGGRTVPRRAVQMAADGPGVVLLDGALAAQPSVLGLLRTGDVLFWDASDDDGSDIDHVGFYLGLDSGGQHRFLSSRKTANGPTMSDVGTPSRLDAPGSLYTRTFRSARRF